MKHVLLLVLLGSVAVAAAAQDSPSSVEVRGNQIRLPERAVNTLPEEIDVYRGIYDMSNGQRMTILRQGRHMYAAVGDAPLRKMVAVGPAQFVAADQQIKIRFEGEAFNMRGEMWMVVPRLVGSTSDGELIRLVASR